MEITDFGYYSDTGWLNIRRNDEFGLFIEYSIVRYLGAHLIIFLVYCDTYINYEITKELNKHE